MKEYIILFENAFPEYEFLVDDLIEEGNRIAVRATFIGVHNGELMGIPPTGKDVSTPVMIIY